MARYLEESAKAFAEGTKPLADKNYAGAEVAFGRVVQEDPNHQKAQDGLKTARQAQARQLFQEAKGAYAARNYIQARDFLNGALGYQPDLKEAKDLMAKVEPLAVKAEKQAAYEAALEQMRYYEGGTVKLAVGSLRLSGSTVVISAGVWNAGQEVHHANPNNFTLIDDKGYSYPYDSETFRYTPSFPAVNLQPGSKASGVVVFIIERGSKPATLVYQGFMGEAVRKTLPVAP
jgi:hypothetical protein